MMKKTILLAALLLVSTFSFAQKSNWAEAKTFHHLMSTTFHPAEESNFKPLREKSDSLLWAAEAWMKSPIPSDYKEKETKAMLAKLAKETKGIEMAVKKNAPDADLKKLITAAHDTFHKIMGECRKDEKSEKHEKH